LRRHEGKKKGKRALLCDHSSRDEKKDVGSGGVLFQSCGVNGKKEKRGESFREGGEGGGINSLCRFRRRKILNGGEKAISFLRKKSARTFTTGGKSKPYGMGNEVVS